MIRDILIRDSLERSQGFGGTSIISKAWSHSGSSVSYSRLSHTSGGLLSASTLVLSLTYFAKSRTMSSNRTLSRLKNYEVFIAAPMSALDASEYADRRAEVLSVIDCLSRRHGFGSVYYAGASISHPEGFTGKAESLRRDLIALRGAGLFVLLYPAKMVTSALVEVGYALALRLPCLLLVHDKTDLPYLLNQAEQSAASDLIPPLRILSLGDPAQTANQIAAFRDDVGKKAVR
jgi:hypothetical protein